MELSYQLKILQNDQVSLFMNPFYPGKFLPRQPKLKISFHTRVHTITLNTGTNYKVYPYIQTSLNQIFDISMKLKTFRND